jgi:predicted Zn-dependent peptidase
MDGVTIWRVPHGPTLIVRPDRTHHVAAFRCYVRGGSIAEWPHGGCGAAHLLEHVTGTLTLRAMRRRALGVLLNASVARDHLCFAWKTAPEEAAASLGVVLEAFRPRAVDAADAEWIAEIDAQRRVLVEELQPHERDPLRAFRQQFLERLLLIHPARYPVSGYADRVGELDAAAVDAYRRRVFRAAHLCVVATGNCDPERLLDALIESPIDLDGDCKAWTLPAEAAEPHRKFDGSFAIDAAASTQNYTEIGFVTPGSPSAAAVALEALSARINRERQRRGSLRVALEGLAEDLVARFVSTAYEVGFFSILVKHPNGAGDRVQAIVRQWLAEVARGETVVDDDNVASDRGLETATLDEQAARLGLSELREGDPLAMERRRAGAAQTHEAGAGHWRQSLNPSPWERGRGEGLLPQCRALDNELRMLALPSVSRLSCIQIVGFGGILSPPTVHPGACRVMTGLLPPVFVPFCDQHMFGLSLTGTADELHACVDALLDCLIEPRYTPPDVDVIRGRLVRTLRLPPANVKDRAIDELRRALFGDRLYGRGEAGTADALEGLTHDDVVDCHRQLCVGANLVVAVSGQAASEPLLEHIATRLRDLPTGAAAATDRTGTLAPEAPDAPGAPGISKSRTPVIIDAGAMSLLALGYRGIAWDLRDWIALELARTLLVGPTGGLATGRLVERLRREGLAYAVDCLIRPGAGDGSLSVLTSFGHHDVDRVMALIDDEISALRDGRFAADEFAVSRKLRLLAHTMLYEEPRRQAFLAAHHTLLSGDSDAWFRVPDEIAAVSQNDVVEVCARLLVESNKATVVASNANATVAGSRDDPPGL